MLRFYFTFCFALTALASFAQCSCGCVAGGSLFGDYSGSAVNEKKKFTAEASFDYKAFQPHIHTTDHVHNHSHGATVAVEETGLEMKAMSTASVGLRYGLSKRATVMASIPFAVLHAEPESHQGIGDVSVAGVYQIVGSDKFALSGLAGVELPTGKQMEQTLASDVVIGSGSYDPFAGLVAIYAQQKILFRLNALYKHNLEGTSGIQYGSNLTTSLSVGYGNATNESFCTPPGEKKATWSVNAIGLVEQNGKTYAHNMIDDNSGGTTVYGGGGFSLVIGRIAIPFSVLIPVTQHLNGEQHQTAFKSRVGAAVTF